jgi:hypothetical protein
MKKRLLTVVADKIRGVIRQALSPTFLIILVISVMLWYALKLNNVYETDIPINIGIDGQKYRITATVKGRGSTILAHQLSLKRRLNFTLDDFSIRRSRETPGAYTISPTSLQRVINERMKEKSDVEIKGVVESPEFVPSADKEDEKSDATKKPRGAHK